MRSANAGSTNGRRFLNSALLDPKLQFGYQRSDESAFVLPFVLPVISDKTESQEAKCSQLSLATRELDWRVTSCFRKWNQNFRLNERPLLIAKNDRVYSHRCGTLLSCRGARRIRGALAQIHNRSPRNERSVEHGGFLSFRSRHRAPVPRLFRRNSP